MVTYGRTTCPVCPLPGTMDVSSVSIPGAVDVSSVANGLGRSKGGHMLRTHPAYDGCALAAGQGSGAEPVCCSGIVGLREVLVAVAAWRATREAAWNTARSGPNLAEPTPGRTAIGPPRNLM